ncbi:hypothetical protein MMC10_009755 [Thelotrema lepadinum]|nr:hypothetical protein [Thelotrema lepadinum]
MSEASEDTSLGRGTRRKKLAGYLKTANEMRQSYTQAYLNSNKGGSDLDENELGIPGAFPNLKVARNGNEEMILFPSYARKHTRKSTSQDYPIPSNMQDQNGAGDAEYWRKEWEFYEDKNAVVDVDVRGWIYSPHSGPMNRKNRLLLGIARHLSGIPAPPSGSQETTRHEDRIAQKQAQAITQRGEFEADVAQRGGYSENPDLTDSPSSSRSVSPKPGQFPHPVTNTSLKEDGPGSGNLSKRSSWGTSTAEMTTEELSNANAHLLRRLKPFFTTPAVGMSLTIFFYNDQTSQSRTTRTNDSGHFNFRAALEFVPTNVRVLASENLSATAEVIITEPKGISLVSDIDDTIKHSAIGGGAKEIFRNAFVRDLSELTIDGVRVWYKKMAEMGVKLHYVSNSPWQMYPLLVTYFAQAQLPPGSFHLKQYTGMLQGIFEPVAERKKATLDRIMSDFPERRFILVGDSGEADLELYTETARREPHRIVAIFIRDVTTTQSQQFFDSSPQTANSAKRLSPLGVKSRTSSNSSQRPDLPARARSEFPSKPAPEEDLIVFTDDEGDEKSSTVSPELPKKSQRPPRPAKPLALRSNSGEMKVQPPVPPPRRTQNTIDPQGLRRSIPTAYHNLPSAAEYDDTEERMSNRLREARLKDPPPLPPRRGLSSYPIAAAQYASSRLWTDGSASRSSSPGPVNKREELWKRRFARAKESLEGTGVILKTWRIGSDVEQEAIKLVQKYR